MLRWKWGQQRDGEEQGGEMEKEDIQAKDRSQEQRERWIQLRANFPLSVCADVSFVIFCKVFWWSIFS